MKKVITNRGYRINGFKWVSDTCLNIFFGNDKEKYVLHHYTRDQYGRCKGKMARNQKELDFLITNTIEGINDKGEFFYLEDKPWLSRLDIIEFCQLNNVFKIIEKPVPTIYWYKKTNEYEEEDIYVATLEKTDSVPSLEELKKMDILDWNKIEAIPSGGDRFYELEYTILINNKEKKTIQQIKLLVKDYYIEMWQSGGESWKYLPTKEYEEYCYSVIDYLKKNIKPAKTVYDYKRIRNIFQKYGQVFTEIYDYDIEIEEINKRKRIEYAKNAIKKLKEEIGKEKVEEVLKKKKFTIAEIKFFTELHKYIKENNISKDKIENAFNYGWKHFYNILGDFAPSNRTFNSTYIYYDDYVEYFMQN